MSKQYMVIIDSFRVEVNDEWKFVQFTRGKYPQNDEKYRNEWIFVKDLEDPPVVKH